MSRNACLNGILPVNSQVMPEDLVNETTTRMPVLNVIFDELYHVSAGFRGQHFLQGKGLHEKSLVACISKLWCQCVSFGG